MMVESLLYLILVIVLIGLLLWAVQRFVPMPVLYKQVMTVIVIVIVILWLLWFVTGRVPLP